MSLKTPDHPIDPYAPPSANVAPDTSEDQRFLDEYGPVFRDASLIQRFLGALVDSLCLALAAGFAIAGALTVKASSDPSAATAPIDLGSPLVLGSIVAGIVGVLIIQSVLIVHQGQSIGKILLRTRIVDAKTAEHPGFMRAVVIRTWIFASFGFIPVIGTYLSLADAVIIFGKQRRCVHDHMAGTRVVDAI